TAGGHLHQQFLQLFLFPLELHVEYKVTEAVQDGLAAIPLHSTDRVMMMSHDHVDAAIDAEFRGSGFMIRQSERARVVTPMKARAEEVGAPPWAFDSPRQARETRLIGNGGYDRANAGHVNERIAPPPKIMRAHRSETRRIETRFESQRKHACISQ